MTPVNPMGGVTTTPASLTVTKNAGATAIGIVAPTDPNYSASQLIVTVTGLPTDGTVYLADGTTAMTNGKQLTVAQLTGLTFKPTAAAGQSSTFSYTVSDPSGMSASGTATVAIRTSTVPADFNGDGVSDILWSTDTTLSLWSINGATVSAETTPTLNGTPTQLDASWSILGIGDFNNDGKADILWRCTDGTVLDWTMNGSAIASSQTVSYSGSNVVSPLSWSAVGVGKFNGAGAPADVLWRNAEGSLGMWMMNGSTVAAAGAPTYHGAPAAPDPSWSIAGIGDFNGDGTDDILWRDPSGGMLGEWTMSGSTIVAANLMTYNGSPTAPDASWSVLAVGDFNGDGTCDVLWRHTTDGTLYEWMVNGSTIEATQPMTFQNVPQAIPLNWTVAEVGDFNGDGKADILWRNSTDGTLGVWTMNGTAVQSTSLVSYHSNQASAPATWQAYS